MEINTLKKILKLFGLSKIASHLLDYIKPYTNPSIKKDEDMDEKSFELISEIKDFGTVDFAAICPWIFTSSVQNHHIVHERIDEASLLWMMTKKSKGNILEIGRAAGGSTLIILGSSKEREVVSIDRDPRSLTIAKKIFEREDVKKRLTLYDQSSRKDIQKKKYGFMFVDGDHSYDGICHDIAKYWNSLEEQNGTSAIAVFHDAQENPHAFVPTVKKALDELMEEKAAEKITAWGAQLAVRKIKNIDEKKWHEKIDKSFWEKYNSLFDNKNVNPLKKSFSLNEKEKINYFNNILGYNNLDEKEWLRDNITVEKIELTADNPIRFLKKSSQGFVSKIYREIGCIESKFTFEIFLRPKELENFQIFFKDKDKDNEDLLEIDIYLQNDNIEIKTNLYQGKLKILGAKIDYLNAFYHCYFHLEPQDKFENFKAGLSFNKNHKSYQSGLFFNCVSLGTEK